MPKRAKHSSFEVMKFLTRQVKGWTPSNYQQNQIVYSQGDPADSVFYVHKGKVKVAVVSARGKEVVVAIRGPDEFCGEGALSGELLRLATVTALTTSEIVRPGKRRRDSVRRDGCNSISAGCRARPRAPAFVTVGARQEETNGSVSLLMKLAKQEARASAWQSKLQSNHGTCGGEIPEHSCQVVFQ